MRAASLRLIFFDLIIQKNISRSDNYETLIMQFFRYVLMITGVQDHPRYTL
jgi:hypothetical protein